MKNKLLRFCTATLSALSLIVLVGACEDENVEMIGVCPEVESTNPTNLATSVPLDQIITVTFNEAINPVTITPDVFNLQSVNPGGRMAAEVTGTLSYDATNATMSFKPDNNLAINTTYTATVVATVKDMMGNAMQEDYVWNFSTGATIAPTVISTSPVNLASDVFLNKTIEARFSIPMEASSLTTTSFTLLEGTNQISGVVTSSGSTTFFNPNVNLEDNTLYLATITTAAMSAGGIAMTDVYEWSFTTGNTAAPSVMLTDPLDDAINVPFNQVISATFSEAMDPATINDLSFLLMQGTTPVLGVVNYSGNTVTFTPNDEILSGNIYTAILTEDIQNAVGIPLANDYEWSFNTPATLGPAGVELKSVARFGIIAGVGVSNEAGFSEIRGLDVGISPGVRSSITGFPPAMITNGAMYASDDLFPSGVAEMLVQAKADLVEVYLFTEAATFPAPQTIAADLGGATLAPGIYKTMSTLLIQNGDLTLDAQGDKNAVWVFQVGSAITTVGGAGGNVILTNGAQAKNIYWQTTSSAVIGDFTSFKGNVLALSDITLNTGATVQGRMLARNGSVVMTSGNLIEKP